MFNTATPFIFDDLEINSIPKIPIKDLPKRIYEVVHIDDHFPVNIINPNMERGPWIAGGACLRWYQNQPVRSSDIDVFCQSQQQADQLIEAIHSYHCNPFTKFSSDNAVTIDINNSSMPDVTQYKHWTIQIIIRKFFNSLQEIINDFDLTVCQIGTAGNNWVLGNNTAKDIREKNLRFNEPLQPQTIRRLVKYWTYGYRPVDNTVENIINDPNLVTKFTQFSEYENAF